MEDLDGTDGARQEKPIRIGVTCELRMCDFFQLTSEMVSSSNDHAAAVDGGEVRLLENLDFQPRNRLVTCSINNLDIHSHVFVRSSRINSQ